MHRPALPALILSLAFAAAPALAQPVTMQDTLGTTLTEVAAALTERGYDLREIEREGDRIEAEVTRDGRRTEIYVDAATGRVTKIELY